MTQSELVDRIASLAEEAHAAGHLQAVAVLYHLCGAITLSPAALQRTFDVTGALSAEAVQYLTGSGETVS